VLIAALIKDHSAYALTYPWLLQAKNGAVQGYVASHSMAELYAKLTRIPFMGGALSPAQAQKTIRRDVEQTLEILSLSAQDYQNVIQYLAQRSLTGGIVYDALILHAGIKAGVDRILTLNARHFSQIYPEHAERIMDPSAPEPGTS
jgi:predicted nucleic acid-binding protein